jgi:primosomal protein N' (replication factor Y) (superfamily II helicase)
MRTVPILLLQHGLGAFDYAVPDGMALAPGDVVQVPLGPRTIMGVVWQTQDAAAGVAAAAVPTGKLRPVAARLDIAPIDAPLRQLIDWAADYYLAPRSAVLRLAMPSLSALEPARPAALWQRQAVPAGLRITPARAAVLDRLADAENAPQTLAAWARVAETSPGVIAALARAGVFAAATLPAPHRPNPDHAPPALSPAQRAAGDGLAAAVAARAFAPILLHGVTGSGKTEVYFEAIAQALRGGGQTLVLLPEIALTQPWLARFAARFGVAPTLWHSGLRPGVRRAAWRAATDGSAAVVAGARSALFLPLPRLALIIVDEAHDSAFKQEDGVQYHARDAAVMRGRFAGLPVVLSTATPALETREQVARGTYAQISLPARFGGATLPAIRMIDLRATPPPRGRWIAPPLLAAMAQTLARGEQALLFLNRRGFAPLTLCRACGERINCPNCTAWMVEHRLTQRLLCHHCGHQSPVPVACPACGEDHSLVACGPGVERLADEVTALFPEARIAQVTSDSVRGADAAAALVAAVQARQIDVLIGTQMITKGYDFAGLTLVGVIDADLGLNGGDLRAGERTFQQIAQVAGRAGRGTQPGTVFIQTHAPQAPIMRAIASADEAGFYAAERAGRLRAAMPPFGRLAAIVLSASDEAQVTAAGALLAAAIPAVPGIAVAGPAPAPLAMLRGRHRLRFLVHARRGAKVQDYVRAWLAGVKLTGGVRLTVDIDPYSFL